MIHECQGCGAKFVESTGGIDCTACEQYARDMQKHSFGQSGPDVTDEQVRQSGITHFADDATLARIAELEAAVVRECNDADKIMAQLGLSIDQARTEGGSLKVAFICNHIQETLDALAATQGLQVDTFNKMVRLKSDADRYRWLRSDTRGMHGLASVINDDCSIPYFELKCTEELDAAIDAAIAKEKENG